MRLEKGIAFFLRSPCLQTFNTEEREGGGEKTYLTAANKHIGLHAREL